MIITKQQYIKGFLLTVVVLALVRLIFPGVAGDGNGRDDVAVADTTMMSDDERNALLDEADEDGDVETVDDDSSAPPPPMPEKSEPKVADDNTSSVDHNPSTAKNDASSADDDKTVAAKDSPLATDKPKRKKHRIYGVRSYSRTFPDKNDVQLASAKRLGVSPVKDRREAEHRMNELVYIDNNPYYHVDRLTYSVPYLVPEAALLLHDIGRAFFDSLQVKGVPLHKPIVTSVLRTKENIKRLRRVNQNATENSCHQYGTTFDITYLRYQTVSPPDEPQRRMVRNDTLKWVLSEVLRDMREQGRCYVKYEAKQACFHMTVRR